jgi:hypothetical protein
MKFEDVENARVQYKDKLTKASLITMSILFVLALIMFFAITGANFSIVTILPALFMSAIFVFAITAIIVAIATRKEAAEYKKTYKAYFVEQNLAKTFTNLQYQHEAGLNKQVLAATQMINTGDRYSSNDLTMGKYKNVNFTQADVHIEEEYTDSDGDTHYTTIFRGRFMIFEFPKKFNFKLEVVSKFFGAGRIPGKNLQTGRKFEKFEVESIDFNKKFKIYAEDGFEAFYLLDPSFILKIEKVSAEYDKKMIFCFVDNKLYIGLNEGKDSFEPPRPSKPINEQLEIEKVSHDIKIITDFVDELSLDRKIFS